MGYNYPHFATEFVQGLYNWQTLIGTLIAIFAAAAALRVANRQNQITVLLQRDADRRRFRAARSTFALSLSTLLDFVVASAQALAEAHPRAVRADFATDDLGLRPLPLPAEIVPALERMIEAAADDKTGDELHDILVELQTFQSRIRSLVSAGPERSGIGLEIEDDIMQAATIYVRAANLLPFARSRDQGDEGELRQSYYATLRFQFNLNEGVYARAYAWAGRRDGPSIIPDSNGTS